MAKIIKKVHGEASKYDLSYTCFGRMVLFVRLTTCGGTAGAWLRPCIVLIGCDDAVLLAKFVVPTNLRSKSKPGLYSRDGDSFSLWDIGTKLFFPFRNPMDGILAAPSVMDDNAAAPDGLPLIPFVLPEPGATVTGVPGGDLRGMTKPGGSSGDSGKRLDLVKFLTSRGSSAWE